MRSSVSMMRDQRGSVAVAFGLSMLAMVAGIGAALDYARLSGSKTELQSALDAALLIAGKETLATGRKAERSNIIASMKANLRSDLQSLADNTTITQTDTKLSGRAEGIMKNRFGSFLGVNESTVAATASVPLGSTRLEVALALDTTGSMGVLGKMEALKQSANSLIDALDMSRQAGTEVAVGIVPFATQVRVPTSIAAADWLTFKKAEPLAKHNADSATWDGCIMDRDKPFNAKKDKPAKGKAEEAFPAQNCQSPNLQTLLPLTTDLNAVRAKVATLKPEGNTNTTIGMSWGYNILDPAAPMGSGAASAIRKPVKALVFLTDGLNTENRYGQNPTAMDADMRELCRTSKTPEIRVFTVRVIEGNDALLRECATNPGDFYSVNDAAALADVFKAIAAKLVTLKLAS